MAWSKAPQSDSFAAITAALMSGSSGALAARSSRLLAAAVVPIDDRALGYLPANAAALFIAFGDMIGFAFLLAGVFGLRDARHGSFR
jgi:hypothetical protein